VIGIIVALLAQTLALGYWGGSLSRLVKQNSDEINKDPGGLRAVRHQHATLLTQHEFRIAELEGTHFPERRSKAR